MVGLFVSVDQPQIWKLNATRATIAIPFSNVRTDMGRWVSNVHSSAPRLRCPLPIVQICARFGQPYGGNLKPATQNPYQFSSSICADCQNAYSSVMAMVLNKLLRNTEQSIVDVENRIEAQSAVVARIERAGAEAPA